MAPRKKASSAPIVDRSLDIVPTKAMLRLQQQQQQASSADPTATPSPAAATFKATVFKAYKAKPKTSAGGPHNLEGAAASSAAADLLDLKRVKQEVFNFGVSGFASDDKAAAKIAQAVRLGARPAKNAYVNYKDLLAEKKRQKEAASESAAMLQLGKNAQGNASVTYRKLHKAQRKKNLDGQITRHYGVVNPKIQKRKAGKK